MFKSNTLKFLGLPNIISFLALFLSWIGIIFLLNNQFYFSFALILVAFILDASDGFWARKLKRESDFGRQLDSHVDVFIYLLYPALSFYLFFGLRSVFSLVIIFIYLAVGIFRLVRFNITGYITSPSASSNAYLGLPVFFNHLPLLILLILKPLKLGYFSTIAYIIILLNSFLMVSKITFPKPKKIWLFLVILFLLSFIMLYIGIYATTNH